jgi:DNA-3-methyladenine glycosylase
MKAPALLPRDFYTRSALEVAPDLLGKILWRKSPQGVTAGRIVEVEAYMGAQDPASHAYRGPTPRTQVMFGEGGFAYVYFTYGNHYCMNVVTGPAGPASAVLIRALEPLQGIELMQKRRLRQELKDLCSGPGKLAQALDIDLRQNGADLCRARSELSVREGEAPSEIAHSPRIGITKATDLEWRFFVPGHPHVSAFKKFKAARKRKPTAKL